MTRYAITALTRSLTRHESAISWGKTFARFVRTTRSGPMAPLDLESAYVAYLNAQPDIVVWHRNGYIGTIRIRNFDETYTLDEWFGDFIRQWNLKDTDGIRAAMLVCSLRVVLGARL